jgi:hypothetical protein
MTRLTPHEAMTALAAAIREYRRAEDLEEAARRTLAGTLASDSNAVLLPRVQAMENARAVQMGAYAAACGAHRTAFHAYAEGAPSGAALLLLKLVGAGMYNVDVDAIEAAIAAVFATPVATA